MKRSTLCLVGSQEQARAIVEKLIAAGFSQDDISVLFSDKGSTREFAHEKQTKLPEGATIGAGTGGAIGGIAGLMAGLGSLAIPGLGPFIAAGPVMAALSGGAIGAGIGGVAGALIGLGVPEYEAKRYEGALKQGGILVSVHTENSDRVREAKRIFNEAGAHDISATHEARADARPSEDDRDLASGEGVRPLAATGRTGKPGVERDAGNTDRNATTPIEKVVGPQRTGPANRPLKG